jgi:hypothetical protein
VPIIAPNSGDANFRLEWMKSQAVWESGTALYSEYVEYNCEKKVLSHLKKIDILSSAGFCLFLSFLSLNLGEEFF